MSFHESSVHRGLKFDDETIASISCEVGIHGDFFSTESSLGVLAILYNTPVRGKVWPFVKAIMGPEESFILVDEKSQLFLFSIPKNYYQLLKFANKQIQVATVSFCSWKKNGIMIAEDDGGIRLYDYELKTTSSYLKGTSGIIAHLIRCHSSRPLVLASYSNHSVKLWNAKESRCIGTLQLSEQVIDIQFIDEFIMLTLSGKGIIWYSLDTFEVSVQCDLPSSERKQLWTAVACETILTSSVRDVTSKEITDYMRYCVCLTSESGFLYLWHILVSKRNKITTCKAIFSCKSEIPSQVIQVSSLSFIHQRDRVAIHDEMLYSRLLITCTHGSFLVLQLAQHETIYEVAQLKVIAFVDNNSLEDLSPLKSNKASRKPNQQSFIASSKDHLIAIGKDGLARILDLSRCIGVVDDKLTNHRFHVSHADSSNYQVQEPVKSIYEVVSLSALEDHLNLTKLKSYLHLHSCFPSKYRSIIWRYLLRLPNNSHEFHSYFNQPIHPSFRDLYKSYPLKSSKQYSKLQHLCSAMSYYNSKFQWDTSTKHFMFLPQLMYPFQSVYGSNDIACFESVLTILFLFGYEWYQNYPQPNLELIQRCNTMLLQQDHKLYYHMTHHLQIHNPGMIAWILMSTLFTEILTKDNWLQLMDHIILFINDEDFEQVNPFILEIIAIVILKTMRRFILSTSDVNVFYEYIHNVHDSLDVNIQEVIQQIKSVAIDRKFLQEVELRHKMKHHITSGSIFPLPNHKYPSYANHNVFYDYIEDFQLKERKKILALDEKTNVKRNESNDISTNGQSKTRDSIENLLETIQREREIAKRLVDS